MAYNPATDFIGLWRNSGGNVSKLEMPGLDFVVSALARAGIVTVSVSATAPVANQSTTAWLQAAVPSTSAEGVLRLWDATASAYAAATPALFLAFIEACAGDSGVSWWTCTGGAPSNTVGNNGDLAIRTDQPGGIYGPKALGAWPASPLPGTTTAFVSADLDAAFGAAVGNIIYRGNTLWQGLNIGAEDTVLTSIAGLPTWDTVSGLLDAVFGNARGSVLYRGATAWAALGPSTAGFALKTQGPTADPQWAVPEFPSGTAMLFYQAAAPTGWTKSTAVNDAGLRVVSGGTGGSLTAGTAFSTVFAQTATGAHTLTIAEMPSHAHNIVSNLSGSGATKAVIEGGGGGASTIGGGGAFGPPATWSIDVNGGGGSHTHPISLQLAYADVIICTKN